jgi:hypothetical protein
MPRAREGAARGGPPQDDCQAAKLSTSPRSLSSIQADTSSTCATAKRCPKCGEVKPLTEFNRNRTTRDGLTHWCKECLRETSRRYREANPEAVRKAARESMRRAREADPEKFRQADRQRYTAQPERQFAASRRWRERVHAAVFDHYGRACACCGTTENLSIDHVNGDGKQHREELGPDTGRIYRWLIKNGFPDGFQVLCIPCNSSKNTGPACRLDHSAAVTT